MATLDHIGLNRYIYMSASVDGMTLGSLNLEEIKNEHSESIINADLNDTRLLLGINLYNNGPYGYSSWQQMRMSENPLSPMGFNQFVGDTSEIKKGSHLGIKIEYKNLNDDVKKAIQNRIKTKGGK